MLCQPSFQRTAKLLNSTSFTRQDIASVVVPFSEEDGYTGSPLLLGGKPAEIEQMGANWLNSSAWRHAIVSAPATLPPGKTTDVEIIDGIESPQPFAFSTVVGNALATTSYRFGITGLTPLVFTESSFTTIYSGTCRRIRRARGRVPGSTVWVELTIGYKTGLSHAWFLLLYGDSDLTEPNTKHNINQMAWMVDGAVPVLWEKIDKELGRSSSGTQTVIVLQQAGEWQDGEMQIVRGTLIWVDATQTATQSAELIAPTICTCSDWNGNGYFPWTSFQPGLPPGQTEATVLAMAASEYSGTGMTPGPWGWGPHFMRTGQTGEQIDFQPPCLAEFQGIATARLIAVGRSVSKEGSRPTHVRNADVSPFVFRTLGNQNVIWSGKALSANGSFPMLGNKNPPGIKEGHSFPAWNGFVFVTQWIPNGRDEEHWTANHLIAYALLTGDWAARKECEHIVELIMAENHIGHFHPNVSGIGAVRAVGREGQSMSALYLVTGDSGLLTFIGDRGSAIHTNWGQKNHPNRRPLGLRSGVTAYYNGGIVDNPWQEAHAIHGLYCMARVTGSSVIREMMWEVGKHLMLYGCQYVDGVICVGEWQAWENGTIWTQSEVENGKWAPYGGWGAGSERWTFNSIAPPAAIILRREAQRRGDAEVELRCNQLLATVGSNSWQGWNYKSLIPADL